MRILAHCLMPNHWHFVLWPENDGDLSTFLQRLTNTHTQRWQRAKRKVGYGHLYQGRFKSFPVEADDHFYAVVRHPQSAPKKKAKKDAKTSVTPSKVSSAVAQPCEQPSKGEPTNASDAGSRKAKADAELDAKYQAWVARLPPDQQAWERVLQENLGGFYLPIHQREKIAGKSNAWDYIADDPPLPRVLLIGDSVSRGYTQAVRMALAGKANVHRAPANCGPTALGLKKIDVWLGDRKWDLVHFNFGIHDRATPIADYTQRLEQLVERMQQTGAKLVWASTTPKMHLEQCQIALHEPRSVFLNHRGISADAIRNTPNGKRCQ